MSQVVVKVVRAVIVILVLAACSPIDAAAQTDTAEPKSAIKRWGISIGAAAQAGGPASQFEAAMRSAGFDDTSPEFFGLPPKAHPYSHQGLLREYNVTYLRNDRLAVGLVMSQALGGASAHGYQTGGLFLSLYSNVTVLAPVAYLRFGEHARVGAGPLIAWTRVSDTMRPDAPSDTSVKGGAMVNATLESSPRRRLYLALNASYRWIAPVTVGPFTPSFSASATFPQMRANLTDGTLGASLGIRF